MATHKTCAVGGRGSKSHKIAFCTVSLHRHRRIGEGVMLGVGERGGGGQNRIDLVTKQICKKLSSKRF